MCDSVVNSFMTTQRCAAVCAAVEVWLLGSPSRQVKELYSLCTEREQEQQEGDCMMEVDDIVEAGNGLWLKVQPAEVCHNVHDKHICHTCTVISESLRLKEGGMDNKQRTCGAREKVGYHQSNKKRMACLQSGFL